MANCWITEIDLDDIRASIAKPGTTQNVTYTTSTATAAAITTNAIRVVADAAVHLAFGASPTADGDDIMVPANTVEYFLVDEGVKVACYDGSS